MADEPVSTTAGLRGLLRMAREDSGLSQAKAAQRVHISTGWWKQIENATQPTVGLNLLLRMFDAVSILPGHLRAIGLEELADALSEKHRVIGEQAPYDHPLDRYLWSSPADPATRHALIAYAQTLRTVRSPAAASPFTDAILATRRGREDKNSCAQVHAEEAIPGVRHGVS